MKKLLVLFAALLIAIGAMADTGDLDVGDYSVWCEWNSSYWTIGDVGPYMHSAMALYHNTNHMRFWSNNRSGGSTDDAIKLRMVKYGPAEWTQVGTHGFVFNLIHSDNNGGYTTTTLPQALTNIFLYPHLEWNGSAFVSSSGWMSTYSGTFSNIIAGQIPVGPNSSAHFVNGGLDEQLNNAATNVINAGLNPGPIMVIDQFHYLNFVANWTNDIVNETHYREITKNMQGTGIYDDEHPGTSGAFGFAVGDLLGGGGPQHLISTNIWSMDVDWNDGTATTNHCVLISTSLSGDTRTVTFHPDRHSMAYDMADAATGRTNDCTDTFVLQPAYSNAFFEVIRIPNAPNGKIQVTEDGSNILVTTGAILRGGLNFFTVTKGAMWDQRRNVLDIYRTRYGYDAITHQVSNGPGFGEQLYQSAANQQHDVNNLTDDALISALQSTVNTVQIQDTNAWAASVPTNHTLQFTQIIDRYAPVWK